MRTCLTLLIAIIAVPVMTGCVTQPVVEVYVTDLKPLPSTLFEQRLQLARGFFDHRIERSEFVCELDQRFDRRLADLWGQFLGGRGGIVAGNGQHPAISAGT